MGNGLKSGCFACLLSEILPALGSIVLLLGGGHLSQADNLYILALKTDSQNIGYPKKRLVFLPGEIQHATKVLYTCLQEGTSG